MFRCALAADAAPQLSLRVPAGVRVAHVVAADVRPRGGCRLPHAPVADWWRARAVITTGAAWSLLMCSHAVAADSRTRP